MEDEESLETCAVQDEVYHFLADGVVTTGVVVGGVLLTSDELLGVEELAVCSSSDLVCKDRKGVNK
jgi:hypothetical protein